MLDGYQPSPLLNGRGNVYIATVADTALAAFTATALMGPLLYNPTTPVAGKGVTAHLLAISYGLTTAATAAGAIGIVGGATTAPTSTSTTGLLVSNARLKAAGAPASQCSVYASGTVSTAGTLWMPTGQIGTSALTAEICDDNFIHLGGAIEVTPGYFVAPAASATLSTAVLDMCLIWLEVPIE